MASSSQSPTPILYACVAHNSTILTESSSINNNTRVTSLAALVLPKIDHTTAQKLTYTHGNHHIHYVSESSTTTSSGGLTFLAIADASLSRRVAFGFLVQMRQDFVAAFPVATTNFADMPPYGAGSFNSRVRELMARVGTQAGEEDAIGSVKKEIEDVRGIMTRNIESLLERGERIDLLVDKTDKLGGSASEFRIRSRGLRRHMWWKNVKLMALLVVVVALIILSIYIAVRNA